MSLFTSLFYDKLMAETEAACLEDWRRELFKEANGRVLEIGAGTGAAISFYPEGVTHLTLAEPDKHMRKGLEERVRELGKKNLTVTQDKAESISADDEAFDTVVSSLVCCSVRDLPGSLNEIKRVLRPGGNLIFLEHVAAAEGTSRRRWQNRWNPIWRFFMDNCHLNRQTEQAILDAGFEIRGIARESMRKAAPIVRPTIRGVAVKPIEDIVA